MTTLARGASVDKADLLSYPETTKQQLSGTSSDQIRNSLDMVRNEYPLSELIGIFAGKWWRLGYDVFFGVGMLIALWDYNVLIGLTMTRTIGISSISQECNLESDDSSGCRSLYTLWVCLFFIWSVVVTLIDFKHQQWFVSYPQMTVFSH